MNYSKGYSSHDMWVVQLITKLIINRKLLKIPHELVLTARGLLKWQFKFITIL